MFGRTHIVSTWKTGFSFIYKLWDSSEANAAFLMQGYAEAPLQNVHFSNMHITAAAAGAITHARGFSFDNVTLETTDPDAVIFDDVANTKGEITYLRPAAQ